MSVQGVEFSVLEHIRELYDLCLCGRKSLLEGSLTFQFDYSLSDSVDNESSMQTDRITSFI